MSRSDKISLVGIILALLLPIVFWWQWLLPKQIALSDLRESRSPAFAGRSGAVAQPRTLPKEQLAAVVARLGTPGQLPERLEHLHHLLRDNSVVLVKAAYKFVPDRSGEIGRYEIQLELDAPYYSIRLFSRSLLAQDRGIALESLDLRRAPGGGSRVRAEMLWVMYSRGLRNG